jgi:hypothetical protein
VAPTVEPTFYELCFVSEPICCNKRVPHDLLRFLFHEKPGESVSNAYMNSFSTSATSKVLL